MLGKNFDYEQCAKNVVASKHMCGGCYYDRKCMVSSRFALKNAIEYLEQERDSKERERLQAKILRLKERLGVLYV